MLQPIVKPFVGLRAVRKLWTRDAQSKARVVVDLPALDRRVVGQVIQPPAGGNALYLADDWVPQASKLTQEFVEPL